MREAFRKFARSASEGVGSPAAFLFGVLITLVWALSGWHYKFSDTWQLVMNTVTSVGTFLIVFLIQNTQSRDAKVVHLKLNELILAVKHARNELVRMEELSDAELDELQAEFQRHRDEAIANLERIERSRERRGATGAAPPLS